MSTPMLSEWGEFYVITGTSGAALTGLMFVVITVSSENRPPHASQAIGAFATPTVVHFSVPLLLAGTLTAPWPTLGPLAAVLGAYSAAGLAYTLLATRRAMRQHDYKPVLEDWMFHSVLPLAAYALLALAAVLLPRHPETGLFAVAATTLGLLLIGIHNAWDTMTYFAAHGDLAHEEPPSGHAPASATARRRRTRHRR
jgi:hypothetical protein